MSSYDISVHFLRELSHSDGQIVDFLKFDDIDKDTLIEKPESIDFVHDNKYYSFNRSSYLYYIVHKVENE